MSELSAWLRRTFPFAYNPLAAAAARAATSTIPAAQSVGQQTLQVIATAAVDAGQSIQSGNSAMAAGSTLIADLEDGANKLASNYVEGIVAGIPFIGGFVAPEAKKLALAGLEFGEQHVHNYVAALFAHHKNAIASTPEPEPGSSSWTTGGASTTGPA